MIRAVLDTNIFLRALINPHSYCGRLLGDLADKYQLALSPAIIQEILEVLHRPRLRKKFPQITELDIERILDLFAQGFVVHPGAHPAISRDPDDEKFLACAKLAQADYLVSEDKDLLVLESYEGTRICAAAEFIGVLSTEN